MSKLISKVSIQHSIQPLVVSITEAAILMGISKRSVYRLIGLREIESLMVGSLRKIRVKEIERYLDENIISIKAS